VQNAKLRLVSVLFLENFCGLTNSKGSDDFDWSRGSNGTNSLRTGPQVDHTTGTQYGHFAFIETSNR